MDKLYAERAIALLERYITDHKRALINRILQARTNYVTVALEDIFQAHNSSAVLRSCDCFGIQNVHIIENTHGYRTNVSVSKGAEEWLTIERYNLPNSDNTQIALNKLKEQGFLIVATTPHLHPKGYVLSALPIDQKMALFFGTERTGLSARVLEQADRLVTIPMYGFTESLNISVSVALCLYNITSNLRASTIQWQLTEEEKLKTKLQWLRKIVRAAPELEKRFL